MILVSFTSVQLHGKPRNNAPKRLLAIDPGKDTGWCLFVNGFVADIGICRGIQELISWLEEQEPMDQIVMEEFMLFKHKALQQSGSKMEVTQAQGIVLSWAHRNGKPPIAKQRPLEPLKLAPMWTGVRMPTNHKNSHHIAAFYHGVYWLVTKGMWELPNGT